MGLLNFLNKKRKRRSKRTDSKKSSAGKSTNVNIKSDIKNIRTQLEAIYIILSRHDQHINENSLYIKKNTQKLEKILTDRPINPAPVVDSRPDRPVLSTGSDQTPVVNDKLDISVFSPQEKRILTVFFENKDMPLSYADIGKYLNKSANTIKNQLRQIKMKADLFNYAVDNQSRKRFKLKNNLKLEKYLNIPVNRPSLPDRSVEMGDETVKGD